jgi:hypothetical protein
MIRECQILIAAILLAACTAEQAVEPVAEAPAPADSAEAPMQAVPTPEVPVPRESIEQIYAATCTWGEVISAGVSIWSYTCPNARLVADEALPGFRLEETAADGAVSTRPVIQFFAKAPDAPLGSVIDAVRLASPGAESCEIEPGSHDDHVLMPTGDAAVAYSKFLSGEAEGPSLPCGPLGPSEAGSRTFRMLPDASDKVIMIDWGTEPPVFDPDTMRAAG